MEKCLVKFLILSDKQLSKKFLNYACLLLMKAQLSVSQIREDVIVCHHCQSFRLH